MKKIVLMLLMVAGFAALAKAQDTTKVKKTPEERAANLGKMMQKKLKLTADQSTQIDAILTDRAEQLAAMKGQKGNRAAKEKLMADADTKIEAILTDDQKKMYTVMKASEKERMKENREAKAAVPPVPAATPAPAQ